MLPRIKSVIFRHHDNSFNTRQEVDVISEEFENRLSGYGGDHKTYPHDEEDIPLPPPPGPAENAQAIISNQCIPHAEDLDDSDRDEDGSPNWLDTESDRQFTTACSYCKITTLLRHWC